MSTEELTTRLRHLKINSFSLAFFHVKTGNIADIRIFGIGKSLTQIVEDIWLYLIDR